LTDTLLVSEAERADAGVIIHSEQEIQRSLDGGHRLAGRFGSLASLRLISQYNPLRPAIGLSVRNGAVESRSVPGFGVRRKLKAADQRECRIDFVASRIGEPRGRVLEGGVLASALVGVA
jgi:hypothetical protein